MAIIVKGGGGKPEEEKTVTAGTSVIEVLPSSGKVMKKVTVNPTPTESKEVTAGTSDITVSPTDGKQLSGVTVHPTPSQSKTITPTKAGLTVKPDEGKLLSSVKVNGNSNLVAKNIKKGVSIFGVVGTLVEGVDLLTAIGLSKIAVDKFTLTANQTILDYGTGYSINHSLGEAPKVAFLLSDISRDPVAYHVATIFGIKLVSTTSWECLGVQGTSQKIWSPSTNYMAKFYNEDNNAITIRATSGTFYLTSGVEYTLITMA